VFALAPLPRLGVKANRLPYLAVSLPRAAAGLITINISAS
jgi:hypothetical protein